MNYFQCPDLHLICSLIASFSKTLHKCHTLYMYLGAFEFLVDNGIVLSNKWF